MALWFELLRPLGFSSEVFELPRGPRLAVATGACVAPQSLNLLCSTCSDVPAPYTSSAPCAMPLQVHSSTVSCAP